MINSKGSDRRRHARQRHQPARRGGPIGAAAVEGQGQQCIHRHWPLCPLFDGTFTLDTVRRTEVSLRVDGEDGFELTGRSSMTEIARDPADLVKQLLGRITSIRTAPCCSSAPCSRRSRTAAPRAGLHAQKRRRDAGQRVGARYPCQSHDALDRGAALAVRDGRADARSCATRAVVMVFRGPYRPFSPWGEGGPKGRMRGCSFDKSPLTSSAVMTYSRSFEVCA